jgi:hypothetical protein
MKGVLRQPTPEDSEEPEKIIDAVDEHMPAKCA